MTDCDYIYKYTGQPRPCKNHDSCGEYVEAEDSDLCEGCQREAKEWQTQEAPNEQAGNLEACANKGK